MHAFAIRGNRASKSPGGRLRDQKKNSQKKTKIADAVDDEGFVAGDRVVGILIPKTDQEIGAKADAFPATKSVRRLSPITRTSMKKINRLR